MNKQLHKKFDTKQVIEIFEKYLLGEIVQEQAQILLKIGRSRFFDWLKLYREKPGEFSVEYRRNKPTHKIDKNIEDKIIKALKQEKSLIGDKKNPIRDYNYSFIKETLQNKHGIEVSLTTIINRAKKMNFTREVKEKSGMTGKF
jgi:hypothetical protein